MIWMCKVYNMQITIAICTYNRSKILKSTLEGLLKLTASTDQYEILVIDNCCTDDTPQILRRFGGRFEGSFRWVREEKQGLSHARNRAIDEASGMFLAFLDDDAIPCSNWVEKILEVMNSDFHPVIAGGMVIPQFNREQPAWATGGKMDVFLFSAVDYGSQPRWFAQNEGPVGANIVYRIDFLERHGIRFDPNLGRRGKALWGGEEGEVLRRVRQLGYEAFYIPEAWVLHSISDKRLCYSDARRRFFWMGKSHSLRSFYGRQCTIKDYMETSLKFSQTLTRYLRAIEGSQVDRKKHCLWRWYWLGMASQAWTIYFRKLFIYLCDLCRLQADQRV
jgi:glycosyltransferase involved in cell wall biosynthesis